MDTADICLLGKNGNKKMKQNVKFVQTFFYQPFGCPKANLGLLTRKQPHLPDVNHNTISSTIRRFRNDVGSQSLTKYINRANSSRKPSDSECNALSHCVTLSKSVLETIDHRLASFVSRNYKYFPLTLNNFHTLS